MEQSILEDNMTDTNEEIIKEVSNSNVEDVKDADVVNTEEPKVDQKPEEKKSWGRELLSWVMVVVVAVVIALVVNTFLIVNANVPSGSMENTIMTKSRMIGLRTAYWFSSPKRGQIVIFKYPDNENEEFVKRVIGQPGEKITIKDAHIFVNDSKKPLKENYLKEEWVIDNGDEEERVYYVPKKGDEVVVKDGIARINDIEVLIRGDYLEGNDSVDLKDGTYKMKDDCFFMLGDNRNSSKDSRAWQYTFVLESNIDAKAEFVYWPLKEFKGLKTAEY